jgi:tRNA threonylcarbamoyl adenosine modification protein YeaZ
MRDGIPQLDAWAERKAGSRGAELLAPLIREVTAKAGGVPSDLGGAAVVRGPGSFTGLRLGPATAAGLARSAGTLTAGLDYLPLLAVSALLRCGQVADFGERKIWVLVHARRKLLYAQAFTAKDASGAERSGGVRGKYGSTVALPDGNTALLTPDEAAALIGESARRGGARPELLGSGIRNNTEAFAALFETSGEPKREAAALLLPPEYDNPAPDALLYAAASSEWSREDVVPWYFRPPDAEENLAIVARALGLDPEAAKSRLAGLRADLLREY